MQPEGAQAALEVPACVELWVCLRVQRAAQKLYDTCAVQRLWQLHNTDDRDAMFNLQSVGSPTLRIVARTWNKARAATL